MKNKNPIGRQYGYRKSANRAIRRFEARYFATIPRYYQFFVRLNRNGMYEIGGWLD